MSRERAYPLGVGSALTRILEAGSGDRHVLLIHGLGARADRWERNLLPLAEAGLHVYACDLPGHGFASKSEAFDYSVRGYSDFVGGLLSELGIDRVSFVGTSLGAHIAGSYACAHPERVERLVMVGAVGLQPLGGLGRDLAAAVRNTSRAGIEAKLVAMFGDATLVTEAAVDEEFRINNSPGAERALQRLGAYFESGIDEDLIIDRLAGLDREILLIWGADDAAVPVRAGRESVGLLRRGRLVEIEAAGHAPYYSDADEFNRLVLEFLN